MKRRNRNLMLTVLIIAILLWLFRKNIKRSFLDVDDAKKESVKAYIAENKGTFKGKPFAVYGRFKDLTTDDAKLKNVLKAAQANDDTELLKILNSL